jgi:imidazolonepropionase-like amidohydrolase
VYDLHDMTSMPARHTLPLLLRRLAILDPATGSLAERQDLLVEDGLVRAIAPSGRLRPSPALCVDLDGCTAVPGLIDCHLHVSGVYLDHLPGSRDTAWIARQVRSNLRSLVRSGVTTVRDMGGPLHLTRLLRRLAASSRIESPRLLVPGPALTCPGGYPAFLPATSPLLACTLGPIRADIDDLRGARAWVDRVARCGVDFVKVAYTSRDYDDAETPIPRLRREIVRAIVERAHHHGLRVAVHCIFADDLEDLIHLPFDTLEHVPIDRAIDARLADAIAARGVPVTTTLMTYGIIDFAGELEELLRCDPERRFERAPLESLRRFVAEIRGGTFRIPFIGRRVIETGMSHMLANVALLRRAGALVVVGTDSGGAITPCGKIAWELRSLVRAGCTPLEALRAATSDAAKAIGRPELGAIAPGRPADVLVCRGDPAQDLGAIEAVEMVVRDGVVMRSERAPVEVGRPL